MSGLDPRDSYRLERIAAALERIAHHLDGLDAVDPDPYSNGTYQVRDMAGNLVSEVERWPGSKLREPRPDPVEPELRGL